MIFTLLIRSTGAGIIGILVGRGIHQPRFAPERGLGTVAMMDVKINHRDPRDAVNLARLLRRDGDAVKKTKAHRPIGFSVVAGRANGAKSIVGLALHHSINSGANCTDRAQRRPARSRRCDGVGIKISHAIGGDGGKNVINEFRRMNSNNLVALSRRCETSLKLSKIGMGERLTNRFEARRTLRMVGAGIMVQAVVMAIQ